MSLSLCCLCVVLPVWCVHVVVCCLQARANRGILYVDEVNLLDDGLVDVVLDSSASGINTVEREGISIAHPAKFIMIGSGNPAVRSFGLEEVWGGEAVGWGKWRQQ